MVNTGDALIRRMGVSPARSAPAESEPQQRTSESAFRNNGLAVRYAAARSQGWRRDRSREVRSDRRGSRTITRGSLGPHASSGSQVAPCHTGSREAPDGAGSPRLAETSALSLLTASGIPAVPGPAPGQRRNLAGHPKRPVRAKGPSERCARRGNSSLVLAAIHQAGRGFSCGSGSSGCSSSTRP